MVSSANAVNCLTFRWVGGIVDVLSGTRKLGFSGRKRWPFRPPRIPLRAPAVAATDSGRRAAGRAAGERVREARYATQPRHGSIVRRTCATSVQAARRHAGEVAA